MNKEHARTALSAAVDRIAHDHEIHSSFIGRGADTYWFCFCPQRHPLFEQLLRVRGKERDGVDRHIVATVSAWEEKEFCESKA